MRTVCKKCSETRWPTEELCSRASTTNTQDEKGEPGAVTSKPVAPPSAQPPKMTAARRMMPGDKIDTMQASF
uniref:Uncharacterized protein n=1 Tax=Ditylenchus dipsaci TaxID=166011 RepID=A0A915E3Q5_9BILA